MTKEEIREVVQDEASRIVHEMVAEAFNLDIKIEGSAVVRPPDTRAVTLED